MRIVFHAAGYMAWKGFLAGARLGALYGTILIFLFPFSTALGALFGGVVGLAAGAICGIVAGLVTVCFFYPLTDPLMYRRTLTAICVIAGFAATLVGFCLLFQANLETFTRSAGIPFILIPSLIAAGVAAHVSRGFASQYAERKREKKDKLKREVVYGC